MEDRPRFAGHRLIEFTQASRETLREIAERLISVQKEIVDAWVSHQFDVWQPPGFSRRAINQIFGGLLGAILRYMESGEIEICIDSLEKYGSELADQQFPFDALVISVHFLEESYMPFLLKPPSPDPRRWLVTMDEFMHVAIAAIANAYFEAYRKELLEQAEVGRIVQESLLGHIPKKTVDLDIAHVYISAEKQAQLGGDFLDSFRIDSQRIAFLIGDLSGHGVDAAADSLMMRSLFKGFMREHPDLADAMKRLNNVVISDLDSSHFATALALSYDLNGHITVVNAGHPYPILCNDECRFIQGHNIALAISSDASYDVEEIELEPGGVFVTYTDGLIEARSTGNGMFGEEGVLHVIEAMRDASARAIAEQLIDDAKRYYEGKFLDDVAVLVLKRWAG